MVSIRGEYSNFTSWGQVVNGDLEKHGDNSSGIYSNGDIFTHNADTHNKGDVYDNSDMYDSGDKCTNGDTHYNGDKHTNSDRNGDLYHRDNGFKDGGETQPLQRCTLRNNMREKIEKLEHTKV